jgi:hypothetical protein
MVQSQPGQKLETISEKQTKSKGTEGLAEEVEHLPSTLKDLDSNPSTTKINKCRCWGSHPRDSY